MPIDTQQTAATGKTLIAWAILGALAYGALKIFRR